MRQRAATALELSCPLTPTLARRLPSQAPTRPLASLRLRHKTTSWLLYRRPVRGPPRTCGAPFLCPDYAPHRALLAGALVPVADEDDDDMSLVRLAALARMKQARERRAMEVYKPKSAPSAPAVAGAPPKKRAKRMPRTHPLPASGYHGVVRKSVFCYQAKTSFNSQAVFIGSFSTPEAAARAYDTCVRGLEAARVDSGSESRFNFISDEVAAAAVAEAERLVAQRLRVMQAPQHRGGAAAADGEGGSELEEEEGGAGGGGAPGGGDGLLDDAGLAEYLNYGASAPAAPRARAAAAPRIKHCTTCGAEMLSRQKLCRVCRTPVAPEDAGGVGLLRGVRIKKVQDGVKYQSFLWHHGKSNYLGTFYTQEEAAKTYDDAYRAACEEDGNEPSAAVLNWPTVEAAAAAVEEARQAANVADRKEISKRKLAKHGAAKGAGTDGAAVQKTLALTAPPATTAAAAPKTKKRPVREVDMFTSDAPPLMQQWTAGHVQPAPQLAAPDAAAAATGSVFDMLGL